jgi:hypothetical protein
MPTNAASVHTGRGRGYLVSPTPRLKGGGAARRRIVAGNHLLLQGFSTQRGREEKTQ